MRSRVLLVVSCGVLALALADFLAEWILYSDTVTHRFLFGA
jgi:hypothetical protein